MLFNKIFLLSAVLAASTLASDNKSNTNEAKAVEVSKKTVVPTTIADPKDEAKNLPCPLSKITMIKSGDEGKSLNEAVLEFNSVFPFANLPVLQMGKPAEKDKDGKETKAATKPTWNVPEACDGELKKQIVEGKMDRAKAAGFAVCYMYICDKGVRAYIAKDDYNTNVHMQKVAFLCDKILNLECKDSEFSVKIKEIKEEEFKANQDYVKIPAGGLLPWWAWVLIVIAGVVIIVVIILLVVKRKSNNKDDDMI